MLASQHRPEKQLQPAERYHYMKINRWLSFSSRLHSANCREKRIGLIVKWYQRERKSNKAK